MSQNIVYSHLSRLLLATLLLIGCALESVIADLTLIKDGKGQAEIISGKREDTYINPDMERGNEQEDLARSSYEMETGNSVKQVGFCEMNESVGASPDGLVGDDGLVEIKCPKAANFVKLLYTKKIETKYLWQMQMQMLVTDRKWVDFVAQHENFNDLIIIRVERDEAKILKIVDGLLKGAERMKEIFEGCK